MFSFAAYTGARRSEIIRSEREDFDFDHAQVSIREMKGDTSHEYTIRTLPLHPSLADIIQGWFAIHPGGRYTITSDGGDEEMSPRMATKHFRQAVAGSKWTVLHGFHVFRHSLASIMACKGKDQRIINAILGHRTEDMERRYRHLFPQKAEQTMADLFR
jgi:integrase